MSSTTMVPESEISAHIANLGHGNALIRQRARFNLIYMGKASVPALVEALNSPNENTRREAIKVLGELRAPETAPSLANMLLDDNTGIRWAAMESLINLGRISLRPVLELFVREFDSSLLREGLHHILHVFKDKRMLNGQEIALFEKLHKADFSGIQTGWRSDAAWMAEKILETSISRNE